MTLISEPFLFADGDAAVSVEDVLMFAIGLRSLPPSGLEPLPQIEFLDDCPFPMANTCLKKWTLEFKIVQDLAVHQPYWSLELGLPMFLFCCYAVVIG